ncbi:MAG TPA: choice-of-anchor P family protein [Chloroflexota bacterium]|jgi:hypothetical protein
MIARRLLTLVLTLGLVLAWLAVPAAGVAQADSTTFSGQATVVNGTVAGVPITLVDTGPVAATGGALSATLLCYPAAADCTVGVPDATSGMVQAKVLHAATVAQGNKSRAEASVTDFSLTKVAGNTISADFLRAQAEATCNNGKASAKGSAEVANLVINGQTITVTGEINQTVPLPNKVGFVIINEQIGSASADKGDITVNALHVKVPGPVPGTNTDLVVAQAHADIACGQPSCNASKDFVTGGGWITITGTPSDAKGTFAVAGGIKNGAFWGHLSYIDHGNGYKVKGTGVTAYAVTGTTSRHIEGTAEINGKAGFTYSVDVDDKGEPGRKDTFKLTLSNAYSAGGLLDGGNIQLHNPC